MSKILKNFNTKAEPYGLISALIIIISFGILEANCVFSSRQFWLIFFFQNSFSSLRNWFILGWLFLIARLLARTHFLTARWITLKSLSFSVLKIVSFLKLPNSICWLQCNLPIFGILHHFMRLLLFSFVLKSCASVLFIQGKKRQRTDKLLSYRFFLDYNY